MDFCRILRVSIVIQKIKGDEMKAFLKKLMVTMLFTVLFVYGAYTLVEQQIQLNSLKSEKEKYLSLCADEDMKHEKLLETKENLNSDSYIEEVAREKLGLVMPYEMIFVDASI